MKKKKDFLNLCRIYKWVLNSKLSPDYFSESWGTFFFCIPALTLGEKQSVSPLC